MLINGTPALTLPANDRAVSFGDGVFTTFRIVRGEVQYLAAHIQRLKNGCRALAISGVEWQLVEAELLAIAAMAEPFLAVGKMVITRGQGGRGYSSEGATNPLRVASHFAFPAHIQSWREQGVVLAQTELQLGLQPALAGHKTLNRLEQIIGKQELTEKGAVEGVFCDSNGYVVECNSANLFWRKGENLFTPDLSLTGVTGIMRQQILNFCAEHHSEVKIVRELPAALEDADELFLCNGVSGPVPVNQYHTKHYDSHFMCRLLQKELDPLHFEKA